MKKNCSLSAICLINLLTLVWLNSKWLHEFIVNYYRIRYDATKPSQCQLLG
uniref:hypothetical protein n=1 Tax=Wolbachia TaxID=953 RepID=UPI00157AE36D|nr:MULTISPECIES: hypothetical protein [Wolbachia]